ncbi:MAG: hypothetical protein ACRD5M_04370 [Candidatus Acidiferrales bacterium]
MESFLNILWLLIAVATITLWRMRWIGQRHVVSRRPLLEWTALACALVLLFFAVSLTDDLHSDVMLADDCFTGRRHTICAHSSQHSGNIIKSIAPATLLQSDPVESLREIERVVLLNRFWKSLIQCDAASARAPPTLPLI